MDWDMKREVSALERIVALLLALANLAERAAAVPFAQRVVVLAILRHAEAVAWAFALGTPCVSTVSGRAHRRRQDAKLPVEPVGGRDGPTDAARLVSSLRLIALIVAGWAAKAHSSTAAPSAARRAMALKRPVSGGGWIGPAALPAPDTS